MTQPSPGAAARPLSPHLGIWRWHVTMFTSIAHRASGIGLYAGALILAGWCVALAMGPEAYQGYMAVLGSIPGKVVMFALTVALMYHLAAGVRHLVWDTGRGFQLKTADLWSWLCIAFAILGSVAVWAAAYAMGAL